MSITDHIQYWLETIIFGFSTIVLGTLRLIGKLFKCLAGLIILGLFIWFLCTMNPLVWFVIALVAIGNQCCECK